MVSQAEKLQLGKQHVASQGEEKSTCSVLGTSPQVIFIFYK